MKIQQVKKVPLEWDKPRVLQYPFPILAMLKERTGIDFLAGVEWNPKLLEEIATVVWAGLSLDDPGLTEEQVFPMLDMQNTVEFMDVITEAITGDAPVPLPAPSGPDTGPSPDTTLDSPIPSSED